MLRDPSSMETPEGLKHPWETDPRLQGHRCQQTF